MKRGLLGGILAVLVCAGQAEAVVPNVTSADQICPPAADPCVIDQAFEIVDGTILDFGMRVVRMDPGGLLDTGLGTVVVLCGSFVVDTGNTLALRARGSNGQGGVDGGALSIVAWRACSVNSSRLCIADRDCRRGTCTTNLCSGDRNRLCGTDGDCQLGPCGVDGLCTADPTLGCVADTDCQLGSCSVRVCSRERGLECTDDVDCDLGTCTVGNGLVDVNGIVRANGVFPGAIDVRGAGDVSFRQTVNVSSTVSENDGGSIDIESGRGSIVLDGSLSVAGGGQAAGGDVTLFAAGDVVVNKFVDASGGDGDGGLVDVTAGHDVRLFDSVLASAGSGAGFGGDVMIASGRDVVIASGVEITTNGHSSAVDLFGGDGGTLDITTGRDFVLADGARLRLNGAQPDGFGGDLTIDTVGDVTLAGEVQVNTQGGQGSAGTIDIRAGGTLRLPTSGSLVCLGASAGGCDVVLESVADMDLAGFIDGKVNNGGSASNIALLAGGDFFLSGSIANRGVGAPSSFGVVEAEACNVDIRGGALIRNDADFGRNIVTSHRFLTVEASSNIVAGGTQGRNDFVFGDPAIPPVIVGSVTPPPDLRLDATLAPCRVCGNGKLEPGETCDDANTIGGDGCSPECQDEGCIAGTPGYPGVSLCDDGDGCSLDRCDAVLHECVHLSTCDDGIDCTVDTCLASTCVHVPDDAACDNGDSCSQDSCSPASGCVSVQVEGACDDGLFCNGSDQCSAGRCSVHTGDPCVGGSECADTCDEQRNHCLSPALAPCSDDGNQCTNDVCNGSGACVHLERPGTCDDGIFCNGLDGCQAGQCSFHLGDPCLGGAECQDACNEALGACASPSGISCVTDGNACTDDVCDGLGGCSHVANSAPCDDGDFCTVLDQCSAGTCRAVDLVPLSSIKLRIFIRSGVDDRLLVKGALPLDALDVSPSESGVVLDVRGTDASTLYRANLAAAAWTDVRGKGRAFRFKDRGGVLPDAAGVRAAVVRKITSRGLARIKLRTKGVDLDALGSQGDLSLSLLFGESPGSGPCLSAQVLPCRLRGTKIACDG